jgi:hypothetical protein
MDYFGGVFALARVERDVDADEGFTPFDCLQLDVFIKLEGFVVDDAVTFDCFQLQLFPLKKRLL